MPKTKKIITVIEPHVSLYQNPVTGIAWVEDGRNGLIHSCHPNIKKTASVNRIKALGYWDQDDEVVSSNGFKYNTSRLFASSELEFIAAQHCECRQCLLRKLRRLQEP
jgi:hypothetical protein